MLHRVLAGVHVIDGINVDCGDPGRREVVLRKLVPVDGEEPRVLLDLHGSVAAATQAPSHLLLEQPLEEVLEDRREVIRAFVVDLDDPPEHVDRVVGLEGGAAGAHLEDQDPEGPPVCSERHSALVQVLGGHVIWRPLEGIRLLARLQHLGDAQVRYLQVPVGGDEEVLELEVAVEDALLVQVLEAEDGAGSKEARMVLWEAQVGAVLDDIVEELPSEDRVHQHVEAAVVLGRDDQVDDEAVLALGQEALLLEDDVRLSDLKHVLLADGLHRVHLPVEADEVHDAVGSHADGLEDLDLVEVEGVGDRGLLGLEVVHLLHEALEDVRGQQIVELLLVQHKEPRKLRVHHHRRHPLVVRQQGALSEVHPGAQLRELLVLLADDVADALLQDVEAVALVAHLDHGVAVLELHLPHARGDGADEVVREVDEEVDLGEGVDAP